ncbi:ATP-binding protein [bacterium]|nr:ATP-binding protein [bacterium]
MFFIIISVSIQTVTRDSAAIETIPDFFARNVESIIEDIGTPPNLSNAMRLAAELDWSINIRNPIMRWSSDGDNRLNLDDTTFVRSLADDAEIRSSDSEDMIVVRRDGYDFYLYQRSLDENAANLAVLYIGLALAGFVLFVNYFMVNRLLDPVRMLRRGAERIRRGDLSYRVHNDRQDELGALTDSINHMADSLQSMLEAKRQLLLAISHELRTPLTKAKLRLEFMPDSIEKQKLREDIDEIDHLIGDLIEAERLNDEHTALSAEPVQLAAFVESVVDQYFSYEGGLEIVLPSEDREFVIDKLRIRLLLTNLLNNAIRHGRDKPLRVEVIFHEASASLVVEDNGEGIGSEHIDQVCEPFYRADSSRQRNTGGFGLGLYLCRLIAQAHGGSLEIDSELGKGTRISIRLMQRPPQINAEET